MPSSISLIVVNYNGGGFLRACVSSALHQADELIVVDNASTDDSLAQIEAAFPAERKLRIIRNRENRGFAAANNAGVKASVGDYILFLNPDCVLTEGSLRRMVEVLNADPKVGMIGGLLVNPDGTEQGGRRRAVPTPWRSFVRAFGLSRFANRWLRLFCDFRLHQQPLPSHPIEVEAISCIAKTWTGACVSGRRSGRSCSFLMGVSSMTKGGCSRSRPIFVKWHKHKGMMRFYRKFFRHQYPGLLMWLVALGVWLRFGMAAGYHAVKRAGRVLGFGRGG